MEIVYVLVVFIALVIGSTTGLGGGVIIKPVLDAISPYDTFVVGIISSFAVFAMSGTSLLRHAMKKTEIKLKVVVALSLGAIIGGFLGDTIFTAIKASTDESLVKVIQASVLIVLLALVLIYVNFIKGKENSSLKIESVFVMLCSGVVLGLTSAFLGVGGGPFNLAVLCLLFSMDMKEASVNSLFLLFFSQSSKLLTNLVRGSLASPEIPWLLILFVAVAAVVGGLVGTAINRKIDSKKITLVYSLTLIAIIVINVYNLISNAVNLM